MSVLDRAIVKAYQRRQATEAACQAVEADRRAQEPSAMSPVASAPQLRGSTEPADIPAARVSNDADVVGMKHVEPDIEMPVLTPVVLPPPIPVAAAERPTYITNRDVPVSNLSAISEPAPLPPAIVESHSAPEPVATSSVTAISPPPVSAPVIDQPHTQKWKWPEICQQLDQFTGDGFRQLAKHLQFAAEQGHKVLGFVSSARNAGRTSVLMTLTRILALEGKTEALLIDTDRRHPHLADLAGYDALNGLGEVLHGQCRLPLAVMPMTPGRISLLPLTETMSEAEWLTLVTPLRALLKQVRREYDMVLIDVGVMAPDTKLADCWLRGAVDAVITISRQLTGKHKEHEVLNWKQIGIESLGVIETFA